ncbi:uncharacterized protein LOC129583517 [Paramacrobiotus metropolitanus]|uniref:uncharacterized protein LOC129583517 n=1 Tax=Paramacrobiotus metropolitanus TaxID=2943436 RepID=UPI0024458971|nr:uncharacterized protein LOC129583517 [Paramacrobiotus metropolitanus]
MPDLQHIQQYLSLYQDSNDASQPNSGNKKHFNLKIGVVGPSHAGKTSICAQIAHQDFPLAYRPTYGARFYTKKVLFEQFTVDFHFIEVGGKEENQNDFRDLLGEVRVFVFVVDLTDQLSFERFQSQCVDTWKKQCEDGLLLGNRSDLVARRQVTTEAAEYFARALGVEYLEISTKSAVHVKDVQKRLEQIAKKFVNVGFRDKSQENTGKAEAVKPHAPPRSRKQPSGDVTAQNTPSKKSSDLRLNNATDDPDDDF